MHSLFDNMRFEMHHENLYFKFLLLGVIEPASPELSDWLQSGAQPVWPLISIGRPATGRPRLITVIDYQVSLFFYFNKE